MENKDSIQEAIDYGIDVTLLYESLSRTPTKRIDNFLRWLKFTEELKRAKQRKNKIS